MPIIRIDTYSLDDAHELVRTIWEEQKKGMLYGVESTDIDPGFRGNYIAVLVTPDQILAGGLEGRLHNTKMRMYLRQGV